MNLLGVGAFLRNSRKSVLAGIFLLSLLTVTGKTQHTGQQQMPDQSDPLKVPGSADGRRDNDPLRASTAERQAKMRNDERQKRLVSDTDKLLALATQLHTDVSKTDKNILSIDVVKRAEEIEKLAHSVKERMRED